MKKVLLTAAVLAACGMASAQKLTYVPYNKAGQETAYLKGVAVSDNGRYVAGDDGEKAFICDMQTLELKFFKSEFLGEEGVSGVEATINSVTNDGVGFGYLESNPTKFDFASGNWTKLDSNQNGSVMYTTSDNTFMCGYTYEGYYPSAVYWDDNGEMHSLPTPTNDWLGFEADGFSTDYANSDGSVIVGHAVDGYGTYPLVTWVRNSDDSYSFNFPARRFFNGAMDAWQPYDSFNSCCISANGKWAAINIHDLNADNDYEDEGMYIGRYDLQADTLQIIKCADHSADLHYYANSIANDGTIVGYTEDQQTFGRTGIIVKAGEDKTTLLSEAYPTVAELASMDENQFNAPCMITPDGRYIEGFGYVVAPDDESSLWYATWLLDTNVSTKVENATADNAASKKVVATYNLDGQRLNAKQAQHGRVVVNRMADGKSVKNVVK